MRGRLGLHAAQGAQPLARVTWSYHPKSLTVKVHPQLLIVTKSNHKQYAPTLLMATKHQWPHRLFHCTMPSMVGVAASVVGMFGVPTHDVWAWGCSTSATGE